MLKEIKCEQKLFVFVTYLYVTFSLLYIGKKVYDNETREDSFPFNIGYFVAILTIHLKAYGYILTKIHEKAYSEAMNYFGWMFMVMAITVVMTCTVGGAYVHKAFCRQFQTQGFWQNPWVWKWSDLSRQNDFCL